MTVLSFLKLCMLRSLSFTILVFCLLFGLSAQAQDYKLRFGKVEKDQVMMTVYVPDSSAEAVVLGETGFSALKYDSRNGFYLLHERHTRIKILKKEGYRWADITVPLYKEGGDSETLNSLKGATYNMENGKVRVTKLEKSSVFNEEADENFTLRKFTFPNVREGSVIEYSYTVRSDFFFNLQDWEFQGLIPKVWSRYTVEIPEYFVYNKYMEGFHPLAEDEIKPGNERVTVMSKSKTAQYAGRTTQGSYQSDVLSYATSNYRMLAENVPGFEDEPYMGDWVDYVSKVSFELESVSFPGQSVQRFGNNWEGLNLSMERSSNFGQVASGSGGLRSEVAAIVSGAASDAEKIASVFSFVKGKTKWDGSHRKYATKLPRTTLSGEAVASSDINLLLVNLLRKAGLAADPVLVSTKGHGKINPRVPQIRQFNHVIAVIDTESGSLFLDATGANLPLHLLPKKDLNGRAWRVSLKRSGWVNLGAKGMDAILFNGDFSIDEGVLKGKVDLRFSDYETQDIRYKAVKEPEKLIEDLEEGNDFELSEWTINGAESLSKPITVSGDLSATSVISEAGDLLFIDPFLLTARNENPFKSAERRYPVELPARKSFRYYFSLKIPEGYALSELPESVNIALPNAGGKFTFIVSERGGVINFRSIFSLSQVSFSPYEYEGLKEFFTQMVESQSGQIILKRVD